MARDPFVEEYQRGMAVARRAKPKKGRKLSLEVPGAKRRVERTDAEIQQAMDVRNSAPRPDTGATLSAPKRLGIERTATLLGDLGVIPRRTVDDIVQADEFLGLSSAAQSLANIAGTRGARDEASAGDYANVILNAPVIGGLAVKPAEMLLGAGVKALGRVGKRALNTRVGRALTEARPLVDEDNMAAAFAARPVAQRRITNRRPVVRGLPAPEQRLGLPAPGPGLPEWAAKPRGGQWWPADRGPLQPLNPANAVKEAAYLGERFSSDPRDKAFVEWFDKALPRYLQNDFATPDDPLRALADQGYIPGVQNAMQWSGLAKQDVVPYPLQKLLFDEKAAATREQALAEMPWLNKLPQTDTIYGVWPREGTQNVYGHVVDEMRNALRAEELGIPADLAVRPESLGRMSFPQAVERVGRINQWRAKQAEQAQLSALNSPAVQMFKEYPDDPRGLRWVELAPPKFEGDALPEGFEVRHLQSGDQNWWAAMDLRKPDELGRQVEIDVLNSPEDARRAVLDYYSRGPLQEALKYEGDVMGHCVGGYCDDVLQGRSRIFSLRDAKGEPHVTIETALPRPREISNAQYVEATKILGPERVAALYERKADPLTFVREAGLLPEDIIQIKGKQNAAPKEDYLPYVQDFVKSGQWGEIGDLNNTGLVQLPDGRLIYQSQWEEAQARIRADKPAVTDVRTATRLNWNGMAPYFEGYARGGRVSSLAAKPCSCDKSLAVR